VVLIDMPISTLSKYSSCWRR